MKRVFMIALALLMTVSLLAGCGKNAGQTEPQNGQETADKGENGNNDEGKDSQEEQEDSFDLESLVTIGDVYALEGQEDYQRAAYGPYYIYVFIYKDTYYRVIADLPDDVSEAIFALEFEDPDYDAKEMELSAPLTIVQWDNLTAGIPTQEELDQWIGRTGEELLDAGGFLQSYNLETLEFMINYDAYLLKVVFEGELTKDYDAFDEYEDLRDLTIKSITYDSIGDAANIEIPEDYWE